MPFARNCQHQPAARAGKRFGNAIVLKQDHVVQELPARVSWQTPAACARPFIRRERGLTLPSRGHHKGRFAPFVLPLMSNVRRRKSTIE